MTTLCGDFKEQDKICHSAVIKKLHIQENKNHF